MKKSFFNDIPLCVSLLITLAIASTEVPLWASLFSFVFVVWRFFHEKFGIYKISPKITPLFGLMFFVIVYIQHRSIFGQEESSTILVGLTAITILNYATQRDHLFMVLLGFLMLVLKSVFSIDFIWIFPALVSYFGLWLSLISNNQVNRMKYVFKTFLRSVPLLVVLFLLFPRIVLFQMQKARDPIVQSGFTEELSPGRFSNIALSEAMVFRAQFLNLDRVSSSQLYWRGAVLTQSNGFFWKKGADIPKTKYVMNENNAKGIDYSVVMEPSSNRNIFVLEKTMRVKNSTLPVYERDYSTYIAGIQPQQVLQYNGTAEFSDIGEEVYDPIDQAKYTQVNTITPRAAAWVEETKQKHATLEARLQALTEFFEEPGFVYTLNPGVYDNDLDKFLFDVKKGFCEHYAAAFGTLARSLGIPTRVVIGYQGGVYNDISQFWKISQKDAHAWVEVGFDKKWRRVDPTGLVTPLRLTLGGQEYFSLSDEELEAYSKDRQLGEKSAWKRFYLTATSLIDSVNYGWTLLLLNYDLQAQLEILKNFNFSGFFIVFGVFAVALVAFYLRKSHQNREQGKHAFYHLVKQIEKWAAKKKIAITPSTTPLRMLQQVENRYPQFASLFHDLAADYERLVYQERETVHQVSHYRVQFNKISKTIEKENTL